VSEELHDFPESLRDTEQMPWERPGDPIVWQWGADMGKLLTDIPSRELVRKRKWLERDPEAFAGLIQAIDDVLTARQGEL